MVSAAFENIMETAEYRNIFKQERSHFFYVAVHRLIRKLVVKYRLSDSSDLKILDAGCGTGGLIKVMKGLGEILGVDISSEAVKLAGRRGVKALKGSVMKLPFGTNVFDVVTSVDVLYHQRVDDDKALREFLRVLKPRGVLVLRVPADKSLTSLHDQFVHTRQRYEITELGRKLTKVGFKIRWLSYIHSPLWPMAKIQVAKERLTNQKESKSGVGRLPGWINWLLTVLLNIETDLVLAGWQPPMGIGLVAVAQKH